MKRRIYDAWRSLRGLMQTGGKLRRPANPLVSAPSGTEQEFLALAHDAAAQRFPEADAFEQERGYAIDREWLDRLALHTQIVKKKSKLNYPHGRLLYSAMRAFLERSGAETINVVETGTARGFSALCMAKALEDAGRDGRIVTIDLLPHHHAIYWNCIDDLEGRKTRSQLLAPWQKLLHRIIFVEGDTQDQLKRLGFERIHFAYLDAAHSKADVLSEYALVSARQKAGDVIFFDDVTPEQFPGVVEAVDDIARSRTYDVQRIRLGRGYAIATRR